MDGKYLQVQRKWGKAPCHIQQLQPKKSKNRLFLSRMRYGQNGGQLVPVRYRQSLGEKHVPKEASKGDKQSAD